MTRTTGPYAPHDIFSAEECAAIFQTLSEKPTALYNEWDLANFPARAWGDLLEHLGFADLAGRAREELAPMSALAAPIFTAIANGLSRKSDRNLSVPAVRMHS